MNYEFYRRLGILWWAIAHDDIRYCRIVPPITLRIARHCDWKNSSDICPALKISLTLQQPSIYLPSSVQEAYERRNWTEQQWEAHRIAIDEIPF